MPAQREPGESRFWRVVLVLFVDKAPKPLIERMRRRMSSYPIEEFAIVGRRTGRERKVLLNLFEVDGAWYIGHPNRSSHWASNLVAAGGCTVIRRRHEPVHVTAQELPPGPERDAAISMTGRLPNPSGFVHRRARRHIQAVGRYFRLTPSVASAAPPETT